MAELTINTHVANEIIDITSMVNNLIPPSLACGFCTVYCPHTTAAITINEKADPDVKYDFLKKLDSLIPRTETYYRHAEGNSNAHLKASLVGFSQTVPVCNGRLHLGIWQGIYFCEFDGPRTRTVELYFNPCSDK